MHKIIYFSCVLTLLLLTPLASNADSVTSSLRFSPINQIYSAGDTIYVDLYADILEADAIFGFSFDLSFDGGITFISSVGDGGTYLIYSGFALNGSLFETPSLPLFDDGDSISGLVPLFDDDVWGNNIKLGTFSFSAPTSGVLGVETITLYPAVGNYGNWGEEGLIGQRAFMPNNPTVQIAPVPEPATMFLFGTGLATLFGLRRKVRKVR